jgi:hypothetical protein
MADISQKTDYQVQIEGTTYSMATIPAPGSALVTKEKQRVLRNLKLDKLISDLMRAGELLFVAYNGVAGFGQLRASVTTISDKLGVLTADCEATMQAFERSAKSILTNLHDCFKFLLQGKEQWAITWLGKAGAAATEMANKADALAGRFDELGNTAVETLGKTQVAQGETEDARERVKKEMADLEAKTAGAKKLAEELLASKVRLESLYEEAKGKAETAENRALALSIVNAVMKPLGEGLGAFAGAMTRAQSPAGVMNMIPPMAPQPVMGTLGAAPPPVSPQPAAAPPPVSPQPGGAPPPVSGPLSAAPPPVSPQPGAAPPPVSPQPGAAPPPVSPQPGAVPPPVSGPSAPPPSGRPSGAAATPGVDPAAVAGAAAVGATLSNVGASTGQMGSDFFSAAEAYRKEKAVYLQNLLKLEKEQRDTASLIAEYAVRLKTAGESKQIAEATVASLFQAIGALKQISVVLRVSAMFWRQMAEHCKELASSDLKEKVTMFMTEPPEQRLVFFLEEDFKVQVVTYLAGWKAVELIAIDYGATCGRVRAQIQEDFKKNPNTEESRRLAPILGARLLEGANVELGERATQIQAIETELASTQAAA